MPSRRQARASTAIATGRPWEWELFPSLSGRPEWKTASLLVNHEPVMVVDEWEDVCNANFSRTLQSVAQRLEHTAGTLDPRHWLPWCKQGQYEGAPFGVTFEGSAVLSAS